MGTTIGAACGLEDVPGRFRSSLARANALFDLCWTSGKPVWLEPLGVLLDVDGPGFRSMIEPTNDAIQSVVVGLKGHSTVHFGLSA